MTKIDRLPDRKAEVLDAILTLRLHVAAFGEQDALGWWDSYALGDVGEYALGRLFPRTARWAALELGSEAARRRQQQLLEGVPGALHLFDLGNQVESMLEARILSHKAGESYSTLAFAVRNRPRSVDELAVALGRLVGDDAVAQARSQTPQSAILLQLPSLSGADVTSLALRRARTLTTAYVHGDRARLVVPYLLPGPQVAS